MTKLNKGLIIALIVQLGLAGILYSRGGGDTIGKLVPVVSQLEADLEADKVTRVQVFDSRGGDADNNPDKAAQPADKPSVDVVKDGDAWKLTSHHDYPAKGSKVTELVSALAAIKSRGPIATSATRHEQLGVAPDSYRRKIVIWTGGGAPAYVVYLGDYAGPSKVAVRVDGSDAVHAVTGVSTSNAPANASGWVDPTYFEVAADRIAWLQIDNGHGSWAFGRAVGADGADTWEHLVDGAPAAPPAGKKLQTSEIQSVVTKIAKLTLAEPADPGMQVSEPLATVTIRLKPEQAPAPEGEVPAPEGEEPAPAAGAAGATPGAATDTNKPGDKPGAAAPGTAPAAAEAAEAPAESVAGEEMVFQIGPEQDNRYYVRQMGNPRAVWVSQWGLKPLVELDADKLYKAPEPDKPDKGAPATGSLPGGGLPPGLLNP